jgi:hypothetical protein
MKKNLIKWCWMIFIVTIAFSVIATTVFAKNTDRGAQEGINVHGHWKIVVMNPDGSVDSVTEFDNTLHGNGAVSLVKLVTGQVVHGNWMIRLSSNVGDTPCDNGVPPQPCRIGESGGSYAVTLHSTNLTVTDNGTSLTLSGSVVATYASTITDVYTTYGACQSTTITIDSCRTVVPDLTNDFTFTTLGTQPSVVPSQLIQVTVDISFS